MATNYLRSMKYSPISLSPAKLIEHLCTLQQIQMYIDFYGIMRTPLNYYTSQAVIYVTFQISIVKVHICVSGYYACTSCLSIVRVHNNINEYACVYFRHHETALIFLWIFKELPHERI